jgi:hypothetical protein
VKAEDPNMIDSKVPFMTYMPQMALLFMPKMTKSVSDIQLEIAVTCGGEPREIEILPISAI